MQASLVMFKADGERKDFPLRSPATVVGRKNTCDLRIPLSAVSRQHFKVELEGDTLMLRDLGSSNGTFYNGDRVLEAELSAGDQVRVGPVTFIVVVDGEPSDIEPVKTVLPESTGEISSPAGIEAAADESAGPEAIEAADEMPELIDDEAHTPTVEIDDDDDEDPIAALEALASAGGDDDDDDEPIQLVDDDEDKKTN